MPRRRYIDIKDRIQQEAALPPNARHHLSRTSSVQRIYQIGPDYTRRLNNAGIHTVQDFINFFVAAVSNFTVAAGELG